MSQADRVAVAPPGGSTSRRVLRWVVRALLVVVVGVMADQLFRRH